MLYANNYRKYIDKSTTQIPDNITFERWLTQASRTSVKAECQEFYNDLKTNLSSTLHNLQLPSSQETLLSERSLISRFDYPEFIWQECDKEMGFALLPIEAVISAEKKTIKEFEGTQFPHSSDELLSKIKKEFHNLRETFDGNASHFVTNFTPNIEPTSYDLIEVPFLNLRPKVHKLSVSDIDNKNLQKLSFRPVVDQSKWVFKNISLYLTEMLTSLKSKVIEQFGSPISDIFVKSGHEVRQTYERLDNIPQDSLISMISADLSNAYSEIMLDDLELAIEFLGSVTGLSDWKIELIISFSRLILQNNYIECSIGLFKLRECLPMGMSGSPICLDIVGLSSEVQRISIHNSLSPNLPSHLYTLLSENELTLRGTVQTYMRYQDDTKAIAYSKEKTDLKFIILNIGTMFPRHIPINIDCFHIFGSFLDVTVLRSLTKNNFMTMVKKKFTSPPKVLNPNSMTPPKIKHSSLYSELLRIRRICSTEEVINLYDNLLRREYKSRGYKNVEKKIEIAIKKIC